MIIILQLQSGKSVYMEGNSITAEELTRLLSA